MMKGNRKPVIDNDNRECPFCTYMYWVVLRSRNLLPGQLIDCICGYGLLNEGKSKVSYFVK